MAILLSWYVRLVFARIVRALTVLSLSGFASLAGAQAMSVPSTAQALLAVQDADPLELARIVRRAGDAAVLRLLGSDQPTNVRLCAARSAPWLRSPEQALLPLALWLAGRDALLSEAAARATLRIAQGLDADTLARRDVAPADLRGAAAALQAAVDSTWLRADLRLLAAQAVAQLVGAGVPAPPPP